MPKFHDTDSLMALLTENGIAPTDAVKRGEFYRTHFDWELHAAEYRNGDTIKQICESTGLSYDTVRNNLKRVGVKFRANHKPSMFTLRKDLMKMDAEIAYLLGWIYADGHVSDNLLNIELQKRDREHLEYLASLLTDKPVAEKVHSFALTLHNREMCKILRGRYLIQRDKSRRDYNFWELNIPREYIPYFLLGLFEGDGHFPKLTPHSQFLIPSQSYQGLIDYITSLGITVESKNVRVRQLNTHGLISVYFKGEIHFRFMTHLYTSTPKIRPLQRKLETFKCHLERSQGRTSPYKKLAADSRDSLAHMKI